MANAERLQTDEGLVERFKLAGRRANAPGERRKAFCALYERHAGAVHAYLLGIAPNSHLADDLTQETFLRAFNGLDGFDGRCAFRTWIFGIAINLFRDHLRSRRPMGDWQATVESRAAAGAAPEEIVQRNEEALRVRAAVASLPEELRAPLVLVRLEGMKYCEAAEALGVTVDAVRMRVHRAHMALAAALTT